MSSITIRRQIVEVDGRAVHLRVAGTGPALLVLHESPRSSVAVIPHIEVLAERYTVYAPDTPGYGLSDPLPLRRPEIADYGRAAVRLAEVLGLERFGVYGTHTGAFIALEMARHCPEKVALCLLDGYAMFSTLERETHLHHYLPLYTPQWSGAHMATLWGRVRDQFTFFPWYSVGTAERLWFDPRPLEFHNEVVADILTAGDGYAVAYSAAFRYDAYKELAQAATEGLPLVALARSDDLLHPYLSEIRRIAPSVEVVDLGPDRPAWLQRIGTLFDQVSLPQAPAFPAQHPKRAFEGENLLIRRFGKAGAEPARLLLHGHPDSGDALSKRLRLDADPRETLVPDLPGSGFSAPLGDVPLMAEGLAQALIAALPAGQYAVEAWSTSIAVARALVALDARFSLVAAHDPVPDNALTSGYVTEITQDYAGSHMLQAWHRARDELLYSPWNDRRHASQKPVPVEVDLGALQAHALAIHQGRNTEAAIARRLISGS